MDNQLIRELNERAKELNCLYKIEEALGRYDKDIDEIFDIIVNAIPHGWQYPNYCCARIIFEGKQYLSQHFSETPWMQRSNIIFQDQVVGFIDVFYTEEMPESDEGPFLKEERKLLDTIAIRIGHNIIHRRLKKLFGEWRQYEDNQISPAFKTELSMVLEMLRRTDQHLFSILSRKMLNHLFCKGIKDANFFFEQIGARLEQDDESTSTEINRPSRKMVLDSSYKFGIEIFKIASLYLREEDILGLIQKWINEEKSHFLVKPLSNLNTPLTEIVDAVRRYYHIYSPDENKISSVGKGILVSLIRRFLTDQLNYINIAKKYFTIKDFYKLSQNLLFYSESYGKLGGKSSGLILADCITREKANENDLLKNIKMPKTWFITSDSVIHFIYYNNLEDVIEQKYKDIEEIRQEYPYIIQAFKNSQFPTELINGLSRALDDFGEVPIIVRSSSLLEDRLGSAFAGKYKSLFLANQGSKQSRLEALMDAIAEVYASTFGPNPIGYRIERGLLDFNEEMGIMIQQVVGKRVGKYFFPAFAGVAFSHNEFRWSSRIKREDGLIRLVTGLGTRAVDRTSDDYPMLIAPGQPNLRVNLSIDEIVGYSQKYIDVINLETNSFESLPLKKLLAEVKDEFPALNQIFSIFEHNHLKRTWGFGINFDTDDLIATFDGLISDTKYIHQIDALLKILRQNLETPIDIEFACDGENLFLLQCRPQSSMTEDFSVIIPKDIAHDKILFTANKYVSNANIANINYIVYVDPDYYSTLTEYKDLKDIGKVVGLLNRMLPKKSFILMGPGRWGSRGDIKLGVNVSYSDINNTTALIEIARMKDNYLPDLSFGTHFFQDLVEADIKYLPLYPDDTDVVFNYDFFSSAKNILTRFLPEYANLSKIIKVINVSESTGGKVLKILMNADMDEAIAFFADSSGKAFFETKMPVKTFQYSNEPLQWRQQIADEIAAELDFSRFGVQGMYLYGTVFSETAGPNSDIDILIHYDGNKEHLESLEKWFEGWNLSLKNLNYNKSGYLINRFLDIKYVTDEDIKDKKYYKELINPKNKMAKVLKKI